MKCCHQGLINVEPQEAALSAESYSLVGDVEKLEKPFS